MPAGVEVRKAYDQAVDLTKESEGFEDEAYNDAANYCTIGYGHLIKLAPCDGSIPEEFQKKITELRGTQILRKDMEKAEIGVMTLVDVELSDGQYVALFQRALADEAQRGRAHVNLASGDGHALGFGFCAHVYHAGAAR